MGRIFVGIAWPYANGPFHIGHLAGAYLPGEVFARFHRLRGDEVLMVSGSDMHGTPILVTAEKEGATPESVARRYDEVNREAFRRLGFTFDVFTNTHTLVHERTVQETFLTLLSHGFIARRTEENAYCPKHQRFLPDRYLAGTCPYCGFEQARGDECDNCGRVLEPRQLKHPNCSLCGTPAEFRPSEHFYLSLDKLAGPVEKFLADKAFWRPNVLGPTRNFLDTGLHATPITRDLDWGVPIPLEGYDSKRFYVWFDAVIGYLAGSREWAIRAGRPEAWRKFWDPAEQVRHYYFIGKDNVFFHTVIWPAILLGHRGLQVPYDVPANEWLVIGGKKIAKSRPSGADVFIPSLLAHYPPDAIRFYAAQMAPQNHDTEFDWDEFHQITEDALSNQWGNLVQRALVLTRERCDGKVPPPPEAWSAESETGLPARLRNAHAQISRELEAVHLKEALELAMSEVREGNRAFHESKPWQAGEEDRRRSLYEAVWTIKACATWLSPFIPFSSEATYRMLGYADGPLPGGWDAALTPPEPGQPLGDVRPLFPRREPVPGKEAPAGPSPGPTAREPPVPPVEGGEVDLEIRAAVVQKVEDHPSADRLYVLTLDAGDPKPRTVVAGIKPYYPKEQLMGRHVVLLANLEPRTIRKVTSQGMVLAGEDGERVAVLAAPTSIPPGSTVGGGPRGRPTVDFAGFQRSPIVVGIVRGPAGPGVVTVDVGGRAITADGTWPTGTRVVVRLRVPGAERGTVLAFAAEAAVQPDAALPAGAKIR